ncbi:porin family protein [uncultured Bacteroides sp.]|uniref:porin family protein n=1 Tax=uncultured Bacteroides sp. TaxID=162156 RepID=UPI002AAB7F4D|nr:porin family protein [uncultured Bacteroides sp.]
MNKYILLLLLVWISIPAAAQLGEQRNNLSIGISGGANYNNVSFTPTIKQKGYLAPTGGITARYISEKYFSMLCGVQLELNYSQRGWEENIQDNTNTYSRTMTYLEVPFLAHLAFGKEKSGLFFINMGPQVAYLLSEKEHYSADWDASKRSNGINYQYGKMAENKLDYGLLGGGGIEIPTRIGEFLLEGRYYLGLADFYKNNQANTDNFEKSSHNTITVKLTYLFNLSK